MFLSLGDVLDGPTIPHDRTPVRKHSHLAGRCEGLFWRRTDRQAVRKTLLAARRYELATRQRGARNGALGFVALEVLELFANLVSFKTGQLDPSIETLMRMLRRSRDAIVRGLKALRDHGFIDWLRRYVPTGNEGRGPQVKQTSNAYRLSIPQRALQLLGRLAQPAPQPDDFSHAQEQRKTELDAHAATLSGGQRVLFDWNGDDELGAILARWGQTVHDKERESASQTESRPKFIS